MKIIKLPEPGDVVTIRRMDRTVREVEIVAVHPAEAFEYRHADASETLWANNQDIICWHGGGR